MADKNTDAPQDDNPKKGNDKSLFLILGLVFLLLAGAYWLSLGPLPEAPEAEVSEEEVAEIEGAFNSEEAETANAEDGATATMGVSATSFNLDAAKKERILGDRSAPIKITEHSSFSCGHCGKFHQETFAQFKSAYIDTGKAYLVFSDFPLNAPALHASMTARCVPEDRYFDFVATLFDKQNEWAYETNYMSYLEKYAAEYGVEKDAFAACLQNEELQNSLLDRVKAVQSQWEVRSTPSFVVNNQEVVVGALDFATFDKAIQDALASISGEGAEETPVENAPAPDDQQDIKPQDEGE